MKSILRLLLTFSLLACIPIGVDAFNYYISFTGSGASATVDSVIVQNLYKSTQVKVPAGTQLRLYDVETSIDKLSTISDFACVYPNPMTDNATFSFVTKNDGNTQISVYKLDGRKVADLDLNLPQGKNSFQLTLPQGVYLVQAKGNGFSYSTKAISLKMTDCQPLITFDGKLNESKPQKVAVPEVKLQYTPGDQILYKGYSGNYCTIVTDKPSESKTTDFKFMECTDADGNHYSVVHIGEQTWMIENLKTTKYRNGEEIGTTTPVSKNISGESTPKYQWAYNGDESNVAKYGRLYTWYTVSDSRNIAPEGWHVASDAEWTILQNYLISNSYNYDGTSTENKIAKSLAATNDWKIFTRTGAIGDDLSKNNSSGFSALPGGFRDYNGPFLLFSESCYWWSSTGFSAMNAWVRYLDFDFSNLSNFNGTKSYGFLVRCLRDL